MSNGDDTDEEAETDPESVEPADPAAFEERLDDAADAVESAETEADLDDVDELLDGIETDLDDAVFEPEIEDEKEDDEEENPRDDLEDRLSSLRDDVEDQRGPYLEEATDAVEDAESTIESSEWADEGQTEVVKAVSSFFESVGDVLGESYTLESEAPEGIAQELATVRDAMADTGFHPDTDEPEIQALLDATDTFTSDLDDATLFTDLEVREQLRREGFYDVLTPETRKDFPPEWNAIRIYEKQKEAEPILSAMEKMESDFMEENALDALEHFAPEEAYEQVQALAQRRNKQAVRILGRIGDERACDTLENFLDSGDVELEKTSLRALGAIGSEDSAEPIAQRLAADNSEIRSAAARALGLLGDTRTVEPLADTLAEDDADEVRASAAWALNQIGTERALEIAGEYADDRSYIVQVEAEKAI